MIQSTFGQFDCGPTDKSDQNHGNLRKYLTSSYDPPLPHTHPLESDRFVQKQADGCALTNQQNATPLRPDSTFIDGFSKLIPQRIAVEICWYIALENQSINVEPGRNGVTYSGFVKTHPHACFCSKRSQLYTLDIQQH